MSNIKGVAEFYGSFRLRKTKPIQSQYFSLLSNFEGADPGPVSGADNNIKVIKETIMLVRR